MIINATTLLATFITAMVNGAAMVIAVRYMTRLLDSKLFMNGKEKERQSKGKEDNL